MSEAAEPGPTGPATPPDSHPEPVEDPARAAAGSPDLATLNAAVASCRACPRLVEWRETVAREKRASYADETYWGRPVPAFGDPRASVLVVGLAPAAHGANRTGRMFTGDRSGDWLFRALHRAGFASRPDGRSADDGLRLRNLWLTAAVHCAPPDNRPTADERRTCRPWLERELDLLAPGLRCIVSLGGFSWDHVLRVLRDRDWPVPVPKPRFGHGAEVTVEGPHGPLALLASYHPSQQNTFTGRLTEPAFDRVWSRARVLADTPTE
ncbi:MAG: uracil-DNA glycosylase [Gemmatimonadales bacterium]|nr:MAG: uracil-DNA glycosylase [Gemmatimonadales bacterium]